MAVTDEEVTTAEARMAALRQAGHAVSARYDRRSGRIIVELQTGLRLTVPARLLEGLAGAASDGLAEIEISPSGLGLYWPRLDADVYVPSLLAGVFGSRSWMAALTVSGSAESAIRPASMRRTGTV